MILTGAVLVDRWVLKGMSSRETRRNCTTGKCMDHVSNFAVKGDKEIDEFVSVWNHIP